MPVSFILLRHLMACERGLLEGYAQALRREGLSSSEIELLTRALEAHERHARVLGEELRALGQPLPDDRDDLWLPTTSEWRGLLEAEQQSHDTWHDALADFPPPFANGQARRIVADHHELMRAWEELLAMVAAPSITV